MNDLLQFCACISPIVIQTPKTQSDSWERDDDFSQGFVCVQSKWIPDDMKDMNNVNIELA